MPDVFLATESMEDGIGSLIKTWSGSRFVDFRMHLLFPAVALKGTLMGTPNREPQEYSRNIIGIYPLRPL